MKEKDNRSASINASLAAAAMAAVGFCNSAHAAVLLQTIYGDGAFPKTGNPYFQYDYIELYNSGASSASLNGLWLDMSGFATEPIALGARNEIPLPSSATIGAGGYYLVQINNGTSSPAFTGVAGFIAPTPDLVLVYNSTQANYSSAYGNPGWTAGNLFSQPYFGAGKEALVSGGSNGTMLDYVGYGSGLASGSVAATTFGTNNYWSSFPGFVGSEYAGYNYYQGLYGTAIPTNADILGSTQALVRTNDGDSYPSEDNNLDWAVETTFSLTNSEGQTVSVPEPVSAGLLGAGAALLMARRRQRQG
ncbi:MAG: PEP-CTERM sorting domain-containing protein [Tepidisphaeraceae bacterium]